MKRLLALLITLTLAIGLAAPGLASADVNDFTVNDFTADYYLSRDDPQGQLRIVEKISVDFTDQNHGILRAIPESYKSHSLNLHINRVSSDSGAPAQYTTYGSNGNEVLKIGDPNRTVTGSQEYTIDYTIQHVITFYNNHDELYWDINGDQWQQPFTAVHATIHMPSGLRLWATSPPVCYTGSLGSTAQDCVIVPNGDTVTADAVDLNPGQTLTTVIGFDKGYFRPMNLQDYLRDYWPAAVELLVPLLLLGGGSFLWWRRRGRDAKGAGVIIPQYDSPDGMKPLEVGAVLAFAARDRDFTATLIDLAIRKYLRIIEKATNNVLGQKKTFALQILRTDWDELNDWERQLMASLQAQAPDTKEVELSKPMPELRRVVRVIRKAVDESLTERAYFTSNPLQYLAVPIAGLIVLVWIIVPLTRVLPIPLAIGLSAGLILLAVFYHLMPARTAKGVAAKEHILGLKMYLEVAEKDRIAKLQSPDAPYAPVSAEPAKTVELFEKLLPYAIVLKVEKQWADKFEDIYKAKPDWYYGNYNTFTAGYLVGSLSGGFGQAVNSSFASPQSSSGSGFSGGGAGGGGGGGGGGGW